MNAYKTSRSTHALSIFLCGLANFLLGISSLYWRGLSDISPITLIAYRITLSAAILTLFVGLFRKKRNIKKLTIKLVLLHCIASLLIAVNWGSFIWASIHGLFLESGLGYLLAPFFSIALGITLYHESITFKKALSALIALSLIIALIISSNNLNHLTYIIISTTWGLYTYIKKLTPLDMVSGLLVETIFLTACLAIATLAFSLPVMYPSDFFTHSNKLIWLAGGVSIVPLLMLSYSTGKIPLSLTGLLQFILPATLILVSILTHT